MNERERVDVKRERERGGGEVERDSEEADELEMMILCCFFDFFR